MSWPRPLLLLLLAVAIPVQTMAAVNQRLSCAEQASGTAPALEMDCHARQPGESPEPPACCDDACPDMALCASAPAVSAMTGSSPAVTARMAPDDRYQLPPVSSRLSYPFRPPTISSI